MYIYICIYVYSQMIYIGGKADQQTRDLQTRKSTLKCPFWSLLVPGNGRQVASHASIRTCARGNVDKYFVILSNLPNLSNFSNLGNCKDFNICQFEQFVNFTNLSHLSICPIYINVSKLSICQVLIICQLVQFGDLSSL